MKKLHLLLAMNLFMGMQQINASTENRSAIRQTLGFAIVTQWENRNRFDNMTARAELTTAETDEQLARWLGKIKNIRKYQLFFEEFNITMYPQDDPRIIFIATTRKTSTNAENLNASQKNRAVR